jgi:hypothetical protein
MTFAGTPPCLWNSIPDKYWDEVGSDLGNLKPGMLVCTGKRNLGIGNPGPAVGWGRIGEVLRRVEQAVLPRAEDAAVDPEMKGSVARWRDRTQDHLLHAITDCLGKPSDT